jgi:hypothetical protein
VTYEFSAQAGMALNEPTQSTNGIGGGCSIAGPVGLYGEAGLYGAGPARLDTAATASFGAILGMGMGCSVMYTQYR